MRSQKSLASLTNRTASRHLETNQTTHFQLKKYVLIARNVAMRWKLLRILRKNKIFQVKKEPSKINNNSLQIVKTVHIVNKISPMQMNYVKTSQTKIKLKTR